MCDFTHLHVHTDASTDGLMPVDALIKRAHDLKFSHLAMTDHGTLANSISFWKAARELDVVPIFGYEGYIRWGTERHHITLNAVNKTGFENLININNYAHSQGIDSKGYPVFTIDTLDEFNEGIVVLTGCPASPLYAGTLSDGLIFASNLVDIFGVDRVFAEIMYVLDEDKVSRPEEVIKRFGVAGVITNDVHFPFKNQVKTHKNMCVARKGFNYTSDNLWLKTPEEIIKAGRAWSDETTILSWMNNTSLIKGMIEPIDLSGKSSLPTEPGAEEKLKELIQQKLVEYRHNVSPTNGMIATERAAKELDVLESKGFLSYIYVLNDIIDYCHSNGIRVGPGRGSAAGSFILFLLGITAVNPLEYGLVFERFLNSAREEYPDVDVDIASDKRQQVLEYAHNRWGGYPIATYSRYSHSSLVRDISRVLDIPKNETDLASENGPESEDFKKFLAYNSEAIDMYESMSGQIRHRGKHAGGIVITDKPVPIEWTGSELVVAWTEGWRKELTEAGIVKYDMLGLNALTQIDEMVALSGVEPPTTFDDQEVYSVFGSGNVNGIFQWTGSDGIRDLTMRVKPHNLSDLSALNALWRPGPIDSGQTDKYPEYKKTPRKIHPDFDKILSETYGVIVYQEQFMDIMALVMGGGLEAADLSRRVIVKPRPEDPVWTKKFESLKSSFFANTVYDKDLLQMLWEEIITFARYGFNKAHSTSYSIIAYVMAWYKRYKPQVFYTALLKTDPSNAEVWLFEAAHAGIEIVPPNVNVSGFNYTLVDNSIFLPLTSIKFLGENGALHVVEERESGGEFKSFKDFNDRVAKRLFNNRVRKLGYTVGVFKGLSGPPSDAINDYESIPIKSKSEAQQEALGFILPEKEIVNWIYNRQAGKNIVCGFIREIEKRKSGRGFFNVYRLSPRGSFWARDKRYVDSLKVGDLIYVEKSDYGSPDKIVRKKL